MVYYKQATGYIKIHSPVNSRCIERKMPYQKDANLFGILPFSSQCISEPIVYRINCSNGDQNYVWKV